MLTDEEIERFCEDGLLVPVVPLDWRAPINPSMLHQRFIGFSPPQAQIRKDCERYSTLLFLDKLSRLRFDVRSRRRT